ncbi:hypothetical protein [Pelagicoccus mobilis]|uniref:Uncharacterized protein n=1 Tax=Pelagicoccus mobilis TaxID=415221 RepID=A0A934VUD8_9BACT|nr:hypothetical protein [Pelagicoccus mobilis]MBK1880628.1 hypothetical protein [Pelagicoccus mobilis]
MLLILRTFLIPTLLSFVLVISIQAELPSQNPVDYDLEAAKSAYQSAKRSYEQRSQEISRIQSQLSAYSKEIQKLQAQNKRLSQTNPSHPSIARNRARILKLNSEIPVLQNRLPKLEIAILPFKSDRDTAKQQLDQVKQNIEQAKDHLHYLAGDLAKVAVDYAHDRGAIDGEREGSRIGNEAGRALGEELGVYQAKQSAIEFGSQSGTQEGTSSGASEAVRLAYDTGEADAWEERGYRDGYDTHLESPDSTEQSYNDAYENGRQRAQNEAYARYLPGVNRADDYYANQALQNTPSLDLEYNVDARPWVSLAKRASKIPQLRLRAIPFENRKEPALQTFPLPGHLQLSSVHDSIAPPDLIIDFHPHLFEPRSFPFVRIPTQSLHNYFEDEYRTHYEKISRIEYEEAYAFHFEQSFHRSAENNIRIYSNPSLYRDIADEAERSAFDHYFENARAETFNRDYPGLYQQVREKAFRSPDTDSQLYQDAYQNGRYNAHLERGDQDGYQDNIRSFLATEEARGFADRDQYYKTNAVLDDIRFHLEDDNRDGVFAINEAFHLSIDLKNLGLTTQGAQQAKIRLHILEGPANRTVSDFTLPPLASQSRVSLDHVLSGLIRRNALAKQTVKIKAELIEFGRIEHSQTFRFVVDYPLELTEINHPARLFSNDENYTAARLVNPTSQSTPSDLQLRLLDSHDQTLLTHSLPALQSAGSNELSLRYLIDQQVEFTGQDLTLELTSQDIVQLRYRFPRSFVSKRYAAESDLLVFIQDHRALDLRPLKDRLASQGLNFDLFSLDQETSAPAASLFESYLEGYIVAELGRNPDSNTAGDLQSYYRQGGSLFVASPNLARNAEWTDFLPQFGLKLVNKTSTQTLKGQSFLEGTFYRNQFTANTRLSFQSPQKGVVAHPLIRSDKRRGFGVATYHAARTLHPINLNTFSLATFSLEELRPNELAFLIGELSLTDKGFDFALERFAQSGSEKQATYRANLLKTLLLETHSLAERLKDKSHKAAASENYQSRLEAFIDFAHQNADSSFLRTHLYKITSELSRKRHSSANRSELKSLSRTLKG